MAHKHIYRLGILVALLFLYSCSSAAQISPQPLNTLLPTWTQTVALDPTTTPPAATRTFTPTATSEANLDATFEAFQLTNATLTYTLEPTASLTPSLSPTTVPPLRAHTWEPNPVLIELRRSGGDGGPSFIPPPTLILYSTGQIVFSNRQDNYSFLPLTTNLSRQEMCSLLNTIDQNGFFNYNSNTYQVPFDGFIYTNIFVNTWESNFSINQGLSLFLDEDDPTRQELLKHGDLPTPVILPSLAKTYKLLLNYNPGSFKYYEPEKLIVWLNSPSSYKTAKPWPLEEMKLAELSQLFNFKEDYFIVSGDLVSKWLREVPNGQYIEGELSFDILARPIWPYEKTTDRDFSSNIPDDTYPTPTEPLECKVIDGVLPIP